MSSATTGELIRQHNFFSASFLADLQPPAGRSRKRVSFADECGKPLVTIKPLTDAAAAVFGSPFIRAFSYLCVEAAFGVVPTVVWKIDFPQPVDQYFAFREKINAQNVVLENAFVENPVTAPRLRGVVRVANIAFDKNVSIRLTDNGWKSFVDIGATFIDDARGVEDRFEFVVELANDANRVEFAVRYRAGGGEYWDNNDGKNYALSRPAKEQADDSSLVLPSIVKADAAASTDGFIFPPSASAPKFTLSMNFSGGYSLVSPSGNTYW